jgi:hypothetical protein
LADLEDLAVPALRKALEGEPTPEVRRRAADLLEKRKGADKALAALRVRRLLEALERSGAKEAIRLLEELVQAAPDARTRQDAKACLERLAKRAAL